ncbi:coiled-coil domain-containing protein 86 [Hoplias malabaricus]|uniref:coiled-coil domain-containing protein 86 n=1 Tax=Hoplias malabaricus TaxID=27720 RepID=UPI0034631B66
MLTRRRLAKTAASSSERKEEENQKHIQREERIAQDRSETTEPMTETTEERTEPGELNSERDVEKENQIDAVDTSSCKLRETGAHAQKGQPTGPTVPLGKPKSGRVWKDRNKQRFSALLRDKPLRSSWEKKMEAKREKDLLKKYQQQLKDQQAREKEEKRKRREENLKRREENERKAEIVQVIRNTTKLKRMKKKQLRKIEKRDTLAMLQKTPPTVKKAK